MTVAAILSLFVAMAISALIPGPSVLAVVSRSMTHGLQQGLLTLAGIMLGDYIFIFLALSGLTAAAAVMGEFASWVKYVGITYLLWLAYQTWNASTQTTLSDAEQPKTKHASCVLSGLVIGLANPKAILFYMGFFPVFVDITTIGMVDVVTIILTSTLSVGGVLATYAYFAARSRVMLQSNRARQWLNRCSASILASCGVMLAVRN
ncbi:Mll4618 protein [Vibrio ponticus]|nr:Mll4618 protein [Vibrio ponticus]